MFPKDSSHGVKLNAVFPLYAAKCVEYLTEQTGVLTAKSFAKNDKSNMRCLWRIHVEKGYRIELTFTSFPYVRSCCDFVGIGSGSIYSEYRNHEMEGRVFNSYLNKMDVVIESAHSIVFQEFRAEYKAGTVVIFLVGLASTLALF